MNDAGGPHLVVHADRRLARRLALLAGLRMVFFVGLPGTGKSLLVHQLAHLAGVGRRIHLLQWDVARLAFEASPAGRRYPVADGVTHAVVRKAAGLWVREALTEWNDRYGEGEHLLVGEAPFVGSRFVELSRRLDDPAEALLAAPSCRFVIAVPSRAVRRFLETERERRAASPLHPREREDAPPHVLRALWRNLAGIARELELPAGRGEPAVAREAPDRVADDERVPYDPVVYAEVYERLLQHRNAEALSLDVILQVESLSVYDFAVETSDLVPTEADAERFIRAVERRHGDPTVLDAEIARWWQT